MDRDAILAAINEAVKRGISRVEERDDPVKGHRYGPQIRSLATVHAAPEVVTTVRDVLMQQSDLNWFIGSEGPDIEMLLFGGAGAAILPTKVANWLLAKSIGPNGSPEKAFVSFESFVKTNAVQAVRVVAVWGIYVEEPVRISQGIWLTPLDYLGPSLGRDHLEDALKDIGTQLPRVEDRYKHAVCAIARGFEMKPAVYPASGDAPRWQKEGAAVFEELEELAHAITLLPGAMPQVISRWADRRSRCDSWRYRRRCRRI